MPPPKAYAPPLMMNQVLFLQDSTLAVIPGSHLDYSEQPHPFREPHPKQRLVRLVRPLPSHPSLPEPLNPKPCTVLLRRKLGPPSSSPWTPYTPA